MPESEQQEGVSILSHGGSATGEGSAAAAAAAAVAAGSAAMEGSAAEVGGSGAEAGGSGATAAGEGSKGPKESAQQAFARLSNLKKKGSAAYWVDLEPVLVTERVKGSDVQVCKLKCTKGGGACGKLLGISNPARTAHDHYSARGCTGVRQEAGQDKLQQAQAGKRAHPSPMTSSSNKQPRITQHMVSAQQLKEARSHLARFFFKSGTALRLVEHPVPSPGSCSC